MPTESLLSLSDTRGTVVVKNSIPPSIPTGNVIEVDSNEKHTYSTDCFDTGVVMALPTENGILEHLDASESSSDESSIDSDESSYYSSDSSYISDDEGLIDMLKQTSGVKMTQDISRSCHSIGRLGRSEMEVTEVSNMLHAVRIGGHTRRDSTSSTDNLSLPGKISMIVAENRASGESEERHTTIPRNISSASVCEMNKAAVTIASSVVRKPLSDVENPCKVLQKILRDAGRTDFPIPSKDVPGFFVDISEERMQHYSSGIVQAVQNADLDSLDRLRNEEGRRLDCCNKFGESVVHIACRRGHTDVIKYLIEEAKIDVRLVDDYGRTAAHDACWAPNPNTELMLLLINECPDLLCFADKRGNTPLEYVRREHWENWCEFLRKHADDVLPRSSFLLGRTEQAGI